MDRPIQAHEHANLLQAHCHIASAVCFLLHPNDIVKGGKLASTLSDECQKRCAAVSGNRGDKVPVTVADMRYMTATVLRLLLERMGEEDGLRDAVKWVLTDMAYTAPEMVGAKRIAWRDKLQDALDAGP